MGECSQLFILILVLKVGRSVDRVTPLIVEVESEAEARQIQQSYQVLESGGKPLSTLGK